MNRHKFLDVACQGNLEFCQGNVREFCFRWSVATLIISTLISSLEARRAVVGECHFLLLVLVNCFGMLA